MRPGPLSAPGEESSAGRPASAGHSAAWIAQANHDRPLSYFSLEDSETSLDEVLLKAVLDDCETSTQAIRLAVKWGDPRITRHQLEDTMEESADGLKTELEEALLMGDCDLVKVLVDFKADPGQVCRGRAAELEGRR